LLNYWPKLTLFLRQPGALIDNNIVTATSGSVHRRKSFEESHPESEKRTLL
jgi:hypothetical protein